MATFYVDPAYTGSVKNGSIENPYTNWNEIQFESDNIYLQKRNTAIILSDTISINGENLNGDSISNIIIGAYGEGELPIIRGIPNSRNDIITMTICDNITIENLELIGDINYDGDTTVACISPSGYWTDGVPGCLNVFIKNCKLSGAYNPIRIMNFKTYVDGVTVENCEIFNATEDGAFIQKSANIEFSNCYIHTVNQGYLADTETGGDGIQFAQDCPGAYIHDCTIDRSDTPKKFCIIWNNQQGGDSTIRIENNVLTSPQPEFGGACIFLKGGLGHEVIGNTFKTKDVNGGLPAIWSHTANIKINYNEFIGNSQGISLFPVPGEKTEIYNNTFYMVGDGPVYNAYGVIVGSDYKASNNIFKLESGKIPISGNNISFNNNCFSETFSQQGETDMVADPLFLDELNNNFQLSETSPCINMGADVGLSQDKLGNPIQGMPDIGAYEYQNVSGGLPSCTSLIQPLNGATDVSF